MHYLAYGSNLHPLRLGLRVPDARLIGTTRLDGWHPVFHKYSKDGSTKCHIQHTGHAHDVAYGAVFAMPRNQVHRLDAAEGLGAGYNKRSMTVDVDGAPLSVFTYLADPSYLMPHLLPYHWYKNLVLAGARYLHFPAAYVAALQAVASTCDDDAERRQAMQALLQRMQ